MGGFSLTGWSRQIHTGFHVPRAPQDTTTPNQYHGKGLSPAMAELSRTFPDTSTYDNVVLQPRNCRNNCGLGSSPVARHYWGNHCYFLFLRVLRCFSSPGSPHQLVVMPVLQTGGLSHSEIPASMVICTSTGLIAAYHVLHRLHEPRHPPCALCSFPW